MASTTMAIAMAPAGLASPLPLDLSSKSAFTTSRCTSTPVSKQSKQCRSKIVCLADSDSKSGGAKFAAALAMAAIVGTASMAAAPAMADVAGLTPCKESKAFAKREKQSIKTLERSLKLYAPDSAPALALNAQIEKTKRRFDFYGKAGLLCGTDGLPHLIVDGDQKHLGEFVYPGIVFLYIAGWIGWVGRSYLIEVKSAKTPTEKEIIIDVPLALGLSWRGFIWPLAAISELRNGKLIEDAANITVSPR